MPLSVPPELKKIAPFVRRAEELDKDSNTPESRLVAYYCRQYAVHTGIPLASTSPAAKECLGQVLATLESEKTAMDNFTRDEAKYLCKAFAERVFDKADEEDRMGAANKNTAKTFYAAASFLQILEQFSEEGDADVEEDRKRIVYAKWKSMEILKAIKEGRTPTPGGFGEEDDDNKKESGDEEDEKEEKQGDINESNSNNNSVLTPRAPAVETVEDDGERAGEEEIVLPPPPAAPVASPAAPPFNPMEEKEEGTEVELGLPPAYPGGSEPDTAEIRPPTTQTYATPQAPPPAPASPPSIMPPPPQPRTNQGGGRASKAQMTDALELTKFALSALEEKDADLAASRLQQALQTLGR